MRTRSLAAYLTCSDSVAVQVLCCNAATEDGLKAFEDHLYGLINTTLQHNATVQAGVSESTMSKSSWQTRVQHRLQFLGGMIPTSWLQLENEIEEQCKQGVHYMSTEECHNLASECGVPEPGFAIDFMNDIGRVMTQLVEGTVFTTASITIEAVRAIVSHSYEKNARYQNDLTYDRSFATPLQLTEKEFKHALMTLDDEATVTWKLLQYAWARAGFKPHMFSKLRILLKRFEIGFESRRDDDPQALLLPCYLPDALKPELQAQLWPEECPADSTETKLRLFFDLSQPSGDVDWYIAHSDCIVNTYYVLFSFTDLTRCFV